MTRTAWAWLFTLALATAAAVVAVLFIIPAPAYPMEGDLPWVLVAAAFGLAEVAGASLVLRSQVVPVSLSGLPLVVGFYFLAPADLVVAQLVGAGAVLILGRRKSLLVLVSTFAILGLGTSLAILVFRATAPTTGENLLAWSVSSVLGAATVVVVSALASATLALIEQRSPTPAAFGRAFAISMMAALTSASVALVAVVFLRSEPYDLWLLLAPAVVGLIGYWAFAGLLERQARLQYLFDVAQILQEPLLDEATLTRVLRRTREMFSVATVEVVFSGSSENLAPTRVLIDANGGAHLDPASADLEAARRAMLRAGRDGSLVGEDAASRWPWQQESGDAMIVPVCGAGDILGTLMVAGRPDGVPPFGTDDLRALTTLGSRLALLAENSRLVERLRASLDDATKLATIVRTSEDAIVAVDVQGRATAWNAGAEHVFGYRAEEMLGQVVAERLSEGERERLRDAFAAVFEGAVIRHARMEWIRADGTRIPVSFTVTPITGPDGAVGGVSAIIRDESDRTRAEAALAASATLLRTLIDASPLGMGVSGTDHRWVQANPALCALLAMPANEAIGRLTTEMIHPDDRDTIHELEECLFDGEPSVRSVERRYVDRAGRVVWTQVIGRLVNEPASGEPVALYLIEDITARRLAEQQTRSTEEQFRGAALAISSAREPAKVLQATMESARDILRADLAAIDVYSDGGSSLAYLDTGDLDPQGMLPRMRRWPTGNGDLRRALTLGRLVRLRAGDGHPGSEALSKGEAPMRSFMAVPILHDSQGGAILYVGSKRDADEFSENDEAIAVALATHAAVCLENARVNARAGELVRDLDRANLELMEASEAKSRFLASVAHELRTPLHAILMAGELVHDPPAGRLPESQIRELGGTIETTGRHMVRLIDDLVDLSRIEAGRLDLRPTHVLLGRVVAEVGAGIARVAEDQGVTLDLPEDPGPTVYADPVRLRQILTNLIANALKFTGSGGRVWLEVEPTPSSTRIRVCDTGIGIAPESLDRAFLPFEQVSRSSTPGAGLGLAISRSLAELHGGRLEATSEIGVGSTFTLTLPVGPEDPGTTKHRSAMKASMVGVGLGRPILVVEDDPAAMDLATKALRMVGYEVWQATGLGAATEQLARATPALILLDLRLGDGDGIDLVTRIRADPTHDDLPILVLSADAMPDDIARAREAGCNDFLSKPVTTRVLLAHVQALIDKDVEAG